MDCRSIGGRCQNDKRPPNPRYVKTHSVQPQPHGFSTVRCGADVEAIAHATSCKTAGWVSPIGFANVRLGLDSLDWNGLELGITWALMGKKWWNLCGWKWDIHGYTIYSPKFGISPVSHSHPDVAVETEDRPKDPKSSQNSHVEWESDDEMWNPNCEKLPICTYI